MNKQILVISFLNAFVYLSSFGQLDTLWLGSITLSHAASSVASTGSPFKITGAEIQLQKSANTIVTSVNHKTIHGINGYQFRSAFYRKWTWGYGHIGIHYSKSLIYPSLALNSSININLWNGMESNIGFSKVNYADGSKLSIINLGATYYLESIMAMYQYRKPVSGFSSHRFMVRNYLKSPKDYVELSLAKGLDIDGLDPGTTEPISVTTIQFSLLKKLIQKLQIRVSFGLTKANNSEGNSIINYGIGLKRDI